jgi:septum formation protein
MPAALLNPAHTPDAAESHASLNAAAPNPAHIAAPQLLLASRSPRRRSLLTEAGYTHAACTPGFEDGPLRPGKVTPAQWVASLAKLKAWAGSQTPEARELLSQGSVVILGADTACVMDNLLIGTPRDADEAAKMVRAFANREHFVVTGVALARFTQSCTSSELTAHQSMQCRMMFADTALVRIGDISQSQLDTYIESNLWQGKAGGYNIAERIAAGWDITYQGDQTSIMGLPMQRLPRALLKMGIRPDISIVTKVKTPT